MIRTGVIAPGFRSQASIFTIPTPAVPEERERQIRAAWTHGGCWVGWRPSDRTTHGTSSQQGTGRSLTFTTMVFPNGPA